jgi:RHS repeat-associated protein
LGRTTTQQWCNCGSLDKVIDGNGNATTWERDLQGRITREIRPDNAAWEYVYENTTSRLKQVTDAKSQILGYEYFLDDSLKQMTFTNAVVATPNVSFTYDPVYKRLVTMVDGTGTTTHSYNPANGSLGAGALASEDGPLSSDTVTYTYDELGRAAGRQVNGAANTLSYTYDSIGRMSGETNALGSFSYTFVGTTWRIGTVTLPNGQTITQDYFDNLGDHRLKEIHNKLSGGATLSKFNYTYDASGDVRTWTQQAGASAAKVYELGYDLSDQLKTATLKTTDPTPVVLKRYGFDYDAAGNRTTEQVDDGAMSGSYNNRNQLTSLQAGGALLFRGTLNEPATVSVQGKPAQVAPDNRFEGPAQVTSGTNTVAVMATDPSGNVRTNTYQVSISGTGASYTYDANGNLTGDGTRAYEYDALNRLVSITQGTLRSEFTYDGEDRRVRVVEKTSGVITQDRRFVFCGPEACEERDGGGSVVRRFYRQGVQDSGSAFFYATDHLGSVRELTDSTGAIRARYDYDPYGRPTKVSGDKDSVLGYTGFFSHAQSGLALARYRAYDPALGRWKSGDPLGFADGTNVYAYTRNNPTTDVDPSGLFTQDPSCKNWGCQQMGGGGPNNPDQPPNWEDVQKVIGTYTEEWCAHLEKITDPKLRACIKKSCDTGKITCKEKCDPDAGGYNRYPILGVKSRTAKLCPNNWPDFTPPSYAGDTVIHEWAHGCGWKHGQDKGVP